MEGGRSTKSRTICFQQNNIGAVWKATLLGVGKGVRGGGGGGGVVSRDRSVFSRTT